jgi:hypothetical protein
MSSSVSLDAGLEVPIAPTTAPGSEELWDSIAALEATTPLERYDVEAQAKALGPSVDALFAFVRDRIRYEAYTGVLRGADGTLAARAGNAFDRSLLLARLLETHGVPVRFAASTLPSDRAEVLFQHMFDGFAPPADRGNDREESIPRPVVTRARRDYPVIRSAIGSALNEQVAQARGQALKDITRHVWVQAKVGGRWQDLDTAFSESVPGKTFASVSETVETMPANWHQRITIRILAERLEDGALKSSPVLTVTRPAVDLITQDVYLVHTPAPKTGMGLGAGGGAGGDRWTPTLLVGDDTQLGEPIDFAEAEGSTGFFDALGGGSSTTFVAEWIEFEVARPDGRKDVVRRTILDRGSAVWREAEAKQTDALAPIQRDDKGPFGARAIHHLLFSGGPQNLVEHLSAAMIVAFGDESLFGQEAPAIDQLFPLTTRDSSSLIWSDNVIVPSLNDTPEVRLFCDSPRILMISMTPGAEGDLNETYDLRRDWIQGMARTTAGDSLVADRKILFGALEGALEHEIVAQDITLMHGDPATVDSTSGWLTSEGVTTLTSADLGRLSTIAPGPEAAARIRRALGQQRPADRGATGWTRSAGRGGKYRRAAVCGPSEDRISIWLGEAGAWAGRRPADDTPGDPAAR